MTNGQLFHQVFISALRNKISHKATLANTITELLDIDKDSVYRRLRGEVSFSFAEMSIIARSLGISLDNIAGIKTRLTKPVQMNIIKHVNPSGVDYETLGVYVHSLKSIKDEPNTKILEAVNIIPIYLYQDYEYITRFYLFKWNQASSYGNALPFHEVTIPERLRIMQKQICTYARHISSSYFVWDYLIIQRLVTDIKYFVKVRLIQEEDVFRIKNDLTEFLANIENMAIKGKYEETGNEVSIFISDVDFDTNYSCLESKNLRLTLIRAYILNAIVALDDEVFNETNAWIRSLQRMSTLISVSGEKLRAIFFNRQREIIQTLEDVEME